VKISNILINSPHRQGRLRMVFECFRTPICAAFATLAFLSFAHGTARADDSLSLVLGRTPELMNTLNLTAQGAGFYKEEHLRVTVSRVKSSLDAQQACSSGQFDICPIGIEPLITNYDKGVRLKMFLTRAAKFTYVYAVLDDSPIRSLADLKGKNIGVHSSDGASATAATESGLKVAGVEPYEYKLVTIGKDNDAIEALVSGKVDAAALPYYEFIPYIIAGRKLRIFPHPALENVTNSGYAISPAVLATKGGPVKRFSRAIVKSALLIRYNPQAAGRAILIALDKPFNDADLNRKTAELIAWEAYLPAGDPDSNRIGALGPEGIQDYIELMKSAAVVANPPPATALVTNEFVGPANDFDHAAFEKYAKSLP